MVFLLALIPAEVLFCCAGVTIPVGFSRWCYFGGAVVVAAAVVAVVVAAAVVAVVVAVAVVAVTVVFHGNWCCLRWCCGMWCSFTCCSGIAAVVVVVGGGGAVVVVVVVVVAAAVVTAAAVVAAVVVVVLPVVVSCRCYIPVGVCFASSTKSSATSTTLKHQQQ